MSHPTSSLYSIEYRVAKSAEVRDALTLVLSKVAPAARAAIVDSLSGDNNFRLGPLDALVVGVKVDPKENKQPTDLDKSGKVVAAAWAQPQSGNAANFWPPESLAKELDDDLWALKLLEVAISQVDAAGIATSQILFETGDHPSKLAFEKVGFAPIAELEYLTYAVGKDAKQKQTTNQAPSPLDFEPYDESNYRRLARLVESTYEASLDCPALTGQRKIDDTLTGYQSTGNYRPENWFFVQHAGEDIGVLLLAEHELAEQYELVYMGLKPEARNQGYAKPIIEHAKQTATLAGADQLMVAVDVNNLPAKKAYERAGLLPWAKRWAYVRSK